MIDHNADVTTDDIFAVLAGTKTTADLFARRAERKRLKDMGRRQNEIEAELEKYSTAVLIRSMRQEARDFWNDQERYGWYVFAQLEGDRICLNPDDRYNEFIARAWAFKKVLGRRRHLPNKIEAYEARKKAATAHHGPSKPGGSKYARPSGRALREKKAWDRLWASRA